MSQMERIQIRGQWVKTYDHALLPVVKEIVDKLYVRASSWRATWNGQDSYQVTGPSGQYVVNMRDFTCSCRSWQLTEIPCTHAIATINKNGKDVADYVSGIIYGPQCRFCTRMSYTQSMGWIIGPRLLMLDLNWRPQGRDDSADGQRK